MSVVYNNDIYLDPLLTSVTWSGDITQGFRKLEVRLKNTVDGRHQAVNIELGRELRLYEDDIEKFRGVIFTLDINATGDLDITAYDENVYLTKNSDIRKFTGMTASAIIRQLCADFQVPVGAIAETGYVIPRLILRDKTVWEMMVAAISETRRQTGRRFWITSKEGALVLIERGDKIVDWVLENGVNITGAGYSQTIEDMRNSVKVTANDDAKPSDTVNYSPETLEMITGTIATESKSPIVATAKDDDNITRFGLMQHIDHMDSSATQSSANQMAIELLKELSKTKDEAHIEALGNSEIVAGSAVYVIESMTSIVGGFYVITDTHTWANGVHQMELSISGDESLPMLNYADLEQVTTEKTRKKDEGNNYSKELALLGE
ncbi:hypothetical protein GC097_00410 [Paenibacillus sp. LMG 31457]|uniref:YqbQ/XkdQ domain-containing protein n=1 Tax=Paenibacillus planticolens TaxID=2654976 RepID=A0ABX1ZIB0_9BACL|nr:hypothetical protein [Paenibacillus planticolens]